MNNPQKSFLEKYDWILPTVIFAITTFIFFSKILLGDAFMWEDIAEYVYPVQNFAASQKGVPFWNPYTFVGMPFYADLQVGYYYVFNRLLDLFIVNGKLPFSDLEFMIIIHYFIAQVSFYFLARSFKISNYSSVFSAITYSFSSLLVLQAIHPMIVFHLAWFPLILMFFLKGIETNNLKYSVISGLLLGMTLLSGHPQTTLYEGIILFLFGTYYLSINGSKKLIFRITAFVLPIIIAGSIFAIQLLPSQELAKLSKRADATYELATEGSLQFKQIYNFINPHSFGSISGDKQESANFFLEFNGQFQRHFYWETAGYFGIVALLFGLYYIFSDYKNKFAIFLGGLAIFSFLFALGSNSFLFNILYNLPLIGTFRNPARFLSLFIIAFSILGGLGIDKLLKEKSKNWLHLIPIALLALFALILSSGNHVKDAISKETLELSSQFYFLIPAAILFLLAYLNLMKNQFTVYALIILAFADLYYYNSSFLNSPTNPEDSYRLPSETASLLKPKSSDSLFRVNMRMYRPSYMAMNRNQGMIDEIMLVEGYNPLLLQKSLPPLATTKQVFDIYNVKYEIAIDSVNKSAYFKERTNYNPRAWLARDIVVANEQQISGLMKTDSFDVKNKVILEENLSLNKSSDSLIYNIKFDKYSNNEIILEVESNDEAMLMLSEIYYPAWKAKLNGTETKIYRANYCFRAIKVGKGKSKIELTYDSDSYNTGKSISLAGLIGSFGLLIALFFIDSKRKLEN